MKIQARIVQNAPLFGAPSTNLWLLLPTSMGYSDACVVVFTVWRSSGFQALYQKEPTEFADAMMLGMRNGCTRSTVFTPPKLVY